MKCYLPWNCHPSLEGSQRDLGRIQVCRSNPFYIASLTLFCSSVENRTAECGFPALVDRTMAIFLNPRVSLSRFCPIPQVMCLPLHLQDLFLSPTHFSDTILKSSYSKKPPRYTPVHPNRLDLLETFQLHAIFYMAASLYNDSEKTEQFSLVVE